MYLKAEKPQLCHLRASEAWSVLWSCDVACAPVRFDLDVKQHFPLRSAREIEVALSKRSTDLIIL